MPTHKLTEEILNAAIEGFESQKKKIDAQIAELRQLLSGAPSEAPAAPPVVKTRRKMSAAARKRIADAQRKRWAAIKPQAEKPAAKSDAPKSKSRLSAAGRKAIIEATKKRWALLRAEKAK